MKTPWDKAMRASEQYSRIHDQATFVDRIRAISIRAGDQISLSSSKSGNQTCEALILPKNGLITYRWSRKK